MQEIPESTPESHSNPGANLGETVLPPLEPATFLAVCDDLRRAAIGWGKKLLSGNPFYPISAALLLYGVYRLAIDPKILPTETAQLFFNFGSLHFYELLLVGTAIILARRKIWYDSSLLVCLENMLVFVPFILVSHAILVADELAWLFCLIGVVLGVGRFTSLARFFPEWPMPGRFLAGGGLLLAANVVFPLMFRAVHKAGDALTGKVQLDAYSLVCWMVALPVLLALVNALPRARRTDTGNHVLPSWLATAAFMVWIAATAVHLYSIGYVYELNWSLSHLVPALWVLAWTVNNRLSDFVAHPTAAVSKGMWLLPALVTLPAVFDGNHALFAGIHLANAAAYAWLVVRRDGGQLAFNLMLGSVAAAVVGMPDAWMTKATLNFTRPETFFGLAALYLMARSVLSRRAAWGMAGGITLLVAVGKLFPILPGAVGLQIGLFYVLVHSLRWPAESGRAGVLRALIAAGWILHSVIWMLNDREMASWPLVILSGTTLALYFGVRVFLGKWASAVIPTAGGAVLLIGPALNLGPILQGTSAGVLALIGSFALFGLGTALAFFKQTWSGPKEQEG